MRRQGVRRLVVVSSIGAGDSGARLGWLARGVLIPLFFRRSLDDKGRMEAIVRDSELDWTIVRPMLLTRGRARGRWRVADDAIPGGFLPRADLASFCVVQLGSDEYLGRTPTVA